MARQDPDSILTAHGMIPTHLMGRFHFCYSTEYPDVPLYMRVSEFLGARHQLLRYKEAGGRGLLSYRPVLEERCA